jgi:hypothetical protein
MGNDKFNSNIIPLRDHLENTAEPDDRLYDVEDVSDFIVDMLDTLMRIAAKKDQSLLVYFLAMARIEAAELKKTGDTGA